MAVDGSLIFDTKMDTDGFEKGTQNLSSKVIELKNKISATEREIANLSQELEKMANTPIKSNVTEKLEKDIAKAKNQLRSLYEEADRIGDAKKNDLTSMGFGTEHLDDMLARDDNWNKVQKQIEETEAKLQGYEKELKQVKAAESQVTGKDTAEYAKKKEKLEQLSGQLNVYKAKLRETEEKESDSANQTAKATEDMSGSIINSSGLIEIAIKSAIAIFEKMKEVAQSVANVIWTSAKKIAQGIGYISMEVGKFTLKQFIGDWESNSRLKSLLLTAASMFSIYKLFDFGKESIDLSSDLSKVQNVVNVTFSSMSDSVNKWVKNAAKSYGLSETMAKKYVGMFGSMSEAFGFTEKQAYNMSTTLAGLTGDVASFYNVSQDEAYKKLKSVFSGETEALKSLGIVMTQTALDSYALANGYNKTVSEMTESEKVTLRYKFVLNQLNNAAGDFARTQNSWANQTRILQLRWQTLSETVGRGLINAFTPVIKILNIVIEKLQTAAQWFENFLTAIFGDSTGSTGAITDDLATANDTTADLADNANDAADAISDIAKSTSEFRENLADFDELNVMDSTEDGSTGNQSVSDAVNDAIKASDVITDIVDTATKNAATKIKKFDFTKYIRQAVENGNWRAIGKLVGLKITSCLEGINWNEIKLKAFEISKNIGNFINGVIDGINWRTLGNSIAQGLNTAIIFCDTLLTTINWNNVGKALAICLNSLIEDFDAERYGKLAADKVNAIFEFLSGFTFTFGWENLGNQIGATLFSYFSNLNLTKGKNGAKSIPQTIAGIINGIVKAGIELFTYKDPETGRNIWEYIGEQLGEGFQEFLDNFNIENAIKMVKEGIGAFIKLIYNAFKKINFKKLGKDTAIGINNWLDDDNWWKEVGQMISEIFNDILDFLIAFINNLDVNKLNEAITNFFGSIDFDGISAKVMYLFQTALLKGISVLLKNLAKNPWFKGLWTTWEIFLENNGFGLKSVYGDDYIKNVLGEDEKANYNGSEISFGENIGTGIADNVSNSYSTRLGENSKIMQESTIAATNLSLEGASGAINKDTTVTTALSTKGTEGKEALTKSFDKNKTVSHFSDVWSGIKGVFGSVKTWFSDIFGDAWDAVKGIFSNKDGIANIKKSVEDVFKQVLNDLIDGLNNAIAFPFINLNSALDTLRNFRFANQKPFNWLPVIEAPQIPKLATGTVVPANYGEFLAVLGDNKRETEVVSPLSTMKQAVKEAISEINLGSNGNGGNEEINIYIDGDKVFKVVVDRNDRFKKSHGKSAFA